MGRAEGQACPRRGRGVPFPLERTRSQRAPEDLRRENTLHALVPRANTQVTTRTAANKIPKVNKNMIPCQWLQHAHQCLLACTFIHTFTYTLTNRQNIKVEVRNENLCVHTHPKPGPDTLCARNPHEYHLRWRDRQTARGKLVTAPHHRRELPRGFSSRDGCC